MLINVTSEDIRKGLRGNGSYCPIARAIRRQTKRRVNVAGYSYCLVDRKKYWLPDDAERFVRAFDDFQHVEPFNFHLPVTRRRTKRL